MRKGEDKMIRRFLVFGILVLLVLGSTACKKELTPGERYEREAAEIVVNVQKVFATEQAVESQVSDREERKEHYVRLHRIVEELLENASSMKVPPRFEAVHADLVEGLTILYDYYPARIADAEMTKVAAESEKEKRVLLSRGMITQEQLDQHIGELLAKKEERITIMQEIRDSAADKFDAFVKEFHRIKDSADTVPSG